MRPCFRIATVLAACALAIGATTADAAFLVQYELFGEPGTQEFSTPDFTASGLTGVNLTRGPGLTPSVGGNSMASSGWVGPAADDFYSFGFDVDAGSTAVVEMFRFATRSSNTGPGFVNVLYAVDGGAEMLLTTITQSGTLFSNTVFSLPTPVNVSSSFRLILRSANNTSANGGTVGATGTLRIGDYSPDGGATFQPIALEGRVVAQVIPEPSSVVLVGLGAAALLGAGRLRRRAG